MANIDQDTNIQKIVLTNLQKNVWILSYEILEFSGGKIRDCSQSNSWRDCHAQGTFLAAESQGIFLSIQLALTGFSLSAGNQLKTGYFQA